MIFHLLERLAVCKYSFITNKLIGYKNVQKFINLPDEPDAETIVELLPLRPPWFLKIKDNIDRLVIILPNKKRTK